MSSCSSIYIEFKRRSDQQWHLLEGFAAGIALVHEFLTDEWFSEGSLRLVFYSC